jgi:hypothetical protein
MVPPDARPVFIHSSFRTCSTWFWAQFRQCADAMAYCEIFHEGLAVLERSQLMSLGPSLWRSGHPPMPPYNLEFAPLIGEQPGVEGFDPSMALPSFIPPGGPTGPISDAEGAYIASLIASAKACGKTPVLADTRSLGRMIGIKARFPGFHIVLYRNLFDQWCSYTDQAFFGTNYFLETINKILDLNSHDFMLRQIDELFPCENIDASYPNLFYRFVFLHLYLYSHAIGAADLFVDVNLLANDPAYRSDVERKIVEQTGLPVRLCASKIPLGFSLLKSVSRDDLSAVLRLISLLLTAVTSEASHAFIASAIADVIRQFECSHFYTQRLATAVTGLLTERDQLTAERGDLAAERDQLRTHAETLMLDARGAAERNQVLDAQRTELDRKYQKACKQLDLVSAERDSILTSRSWRIGLPLRLIGTWAGRAFSLVRRIGAR